MVLRSYLLAISPNPFECLVPLHDIGKSATKTKKGRWTANTTGLPLNILCQEWVHRNVTNKS